MYILLHTLGLIGCHSISLDTLQFVTKSTLALLVNISRAYAEKYG